MGIVAGDAWKLLTVFQRPVLSGAEDIGSWQTIFTMLSVAAVITNAGKPPSLLPSLCVITALVLCAGIATFTMTTFDDYSFGTKMWIFIGFQYVCFLLQGLIMAVVPDEPETRKIQLKRTEFLVEKLIDRVQDDEINEEAGKQYDLNDISIEEYPLREHVGTFQALKLEGAAVETQSSIRSSKNPLQLS